MVLLCRRRCHLLTAALVEIDILDWTEGAGSCLISTGMSESFSALSNYTSLGVDGGTDLRKKKASGWQTPQWRRYETLF